MYHLVVMTAAIIRSDTLLPLSCLIFKKIICVLISVIYGFKSFLFTLLFSQL